MKIIRILVYEGNEGWIRSSLSSGRGVVGELVTSYGSIKEFYIQSPIQLPTESPFDIEKEGEKS